MPLSLGTSRSADPTLHFLETSVAHPRAPVGAQSDCPFVRGGGAGAAETGTVDQLRSRKGRAAGIDLAGRPLNASGDRMRNS